jgi:hypothetical protein
MRNIHKTQTFIYTIDELRKISRSLNQLYTLGCNQSLTEKQVKREENLEKKAIKMAKEIGFKIYFQTDPRGCSVFIGNKDINKSNYVERGIALY